MISKKPICLLRTGVFAFGGLAALVQLLAELLSFDPTANYFVRSAALPIVACVLTGLGVLCALVLAFLDKKEHTTPSRFAFLAPAVCFCVLCPALFASIGTSVVVADRLAIVSMIFCLLASLFCLLSIFLKDEQQRGLLALLGLSPVVALASLTLFFYFDKSIEMNSPLKVALQAGLLFGMFLFLCEVRRLLGRPLPRLLAGLRLALFPVASLGSCLLIPLAIAGRFRRFDYLLGGLLLLSLQATLIFDLFAKHD